MYEQQQRLPGTSIPLATPVYGGSSAAVDVDPMAMWNSFVGTLSRRRRLFAMIVFGVIFAVALVTLHDAQALHDRRQDDRRQPEHDRAEPGRRADAACRCSTRCCSRTPRSRPRPTPS